MTINNDKIITHTTEDGNKEGERIGDEVKTLELTENDVLLGRGGNGFKHYGNQKLKNMSNACMYRYNSVKKSEKPLIAKAIFDQVRTLNPPGRFLKRKPGTTVSWVEVSEEVGIEKVSQVLRDLRRQNSPRDARTDMNNQGMLMQQMQLSLNNSSGFLPPPSQSLASTCGPHDLWSPPPLPPCNCLPPRLTPLHNSIESHYNGTVSYSLNCNRCNRHYEDQVTYVDGTVRTQTMVVRGEDKCYNDRMGQVTTSPPLSNNQSFFHLGDIYPPPPPIPNVSYHSNNNFSGAPMAPLDTNNRNFRINKRKYYDECAMFPGDGGRYNQDGTSMPKRKYLFNGRNGPSMSHLQY